MPRPAHHRRLILFPVLAVLFFLVGIAEVHAKLVTIVDLSSGRRLPSRSPAQAGPSLPESVPSEAGRVFPSAPSFVPRLSSAPLADPALATYSYETSGPSYRSHNQTTAYDYDSEPERLSNNALLGSDSPADFLFIRPGHVRPAAQANAPNSQNYVYDDTLIFLTAEKAARLSGPKVPAYHSGNFTGEKYVNHQVSGDELFHKYLYANADPVMFRDPSGNFSLTELMETVQIIGRLAARAVINYFKSGARKPKIADVYLAIGTGASSGGIAGKLLGHAWLYLDFLHTGNGFRYDVGLVTSSMARYGRSALLGKVLGIFDGKIVEEPASRIEGRDGAKLWVKIASFSTGQFIAWRLSLAYVIGETSTAPYRILPGGDTINCYTWTGEAALKAIIIGRVPYL